VGIVNFVTFLQNTKAYRRALRESEYGPLTDSAFLATISPIHKVDKIKAALMVVHGENDPRVPIGEARQIIEAMQARGAEVESLIYPDEGHGIAKLGNRLEYYRKMVEFFDKYLKSSS
jgi:dipeptidyl aminopeptidase/acylaminoacyl peptidase